MRDFNYKKAWYLFAKPAFDGLNHAQANAHSEVRALVGELEQGMDLNIPMTDAVRGILVELTSKELAELSRASHFYGYWKPRLEKSAFDNRRGEAWKVSNCIDQILRKRLEPPPNVQIHEGIFRVTFADLECWLWYEFGLATEENLEMFKTCALDFGVGQIENSAKTLADQTGDLWPTNKLDELPDNKGYRQFLSLKKT